MGAGIGVVDAFVCDTRMDVGVCWHVCTGVWGQRTVPGVYLSHVLPYFLRQGSH